MGYHEEIHLPCTTLISFRKNQDKARGAAYDPKQTHWGSFYNFATCGNYLSVQDFVPKIRDNGWTQCQDCADAKLAARRERDARRRLGTTEFLVHYQPSMPAQNQQIFSNSDLQSALHATTSDTHPPSASSYGGLSSTTADNRRVSATSLVSASTYNTAMSNDTQGTDMNGASGRTVGTDDGRRCSHAPSQDRLPSINELAPKVSYGSSNQAAHYDAYHTPSFRRETLASDAFGATQAAEDQFQAPVRQMRSRALQQGDGRFINPGEAGYKDPDAPQPVRRGGWVTRGEEGWVEWNAPVGDDGDYVDSENERETTDWRRRQRRCFR